VKLLNINPTIKIESVSFNFLETKKTKDNTNKLPKMEANNIPILETKSSAKKPGKI
jgi:hypothetical protein